ncbi:MAG: hypothetical protein U0525_00965 [Patescibacteria group bacterium]
MFGLILLSITTALMLSLFVITFGFLPPEVPLYFSHQWGEMQLGSKWELLIIPFVMLAFYGVLNLYKRKALSDDNHILFQILNFVSIAEIAFCTFAFIRIIFIVIW